MFQIKENIQKRNKDQHLFDHICINPNNEGQSVKVCDLCYTLIITEQQIMELQQSIAICNNIPIENNDTEDKKNTVPEGLKKVEHEIESVNQWRILLYFKYFSC